MKRISQAGTQKVKVESVIIWPKCDFCGSCHPNDTSKCPKIKWFDRNFHTPKA